MAENKMTIEQRLQKMKSIYEKMETMINGLPDAVPGSVKETLKSKILGDKDLKRLIDGIDAHRPPRIFLIGRTGVGKSSLINAICGSYVAKVSDVHSCTEKVQIYNCMDGDRVLMEICDTRGIAESERLHSKLSAEEMLVEEINAFSPDVAIMVLSATHRDGVDSDVEFLKKLSKAYMDCNQLRLPIVVVVNKADEVPSVLAKDPSTYSEKKIANIGRVVSYYKGIIVKNGLKIDDIIAVSSLIEWKLPDGNEVDAEDIDNLPISDVESLEIGFDGRYHIKELIDILENAIQDFEAQMGLRMALRLNEVIHKLAKHLTAIFSSIAGVVALTPIPASDIYILVTLQALLVSMIAALSGREISMESAKEFIVGLGGVASLGFVFRTIAQQTSKLANALFPGAGSAVSAGIASSGTTAIGNSAISYYIDNISIEDVKKKYKKEQETEK